MLPSCLPIFLKVLKVNLETFRWWFPRDYRDYRDYKQILPFCRPAVLYQESCNIVKQKLLRRWFIYSLAVLLSCRCIYENLHNHFQQFLLTTSNSSLLIIFQRKAALFSLNKTKLIVQKYRLHKIEVIIWKEGKEGPSSIDFYLFQRNSTPIPLIKPKASSSMVFLIKMTQNRVIH